MTTLQRRVFVGGVSCKDARGVALETARRFMPPSFDFVKNSGSKRTHTDGGVAGTRVQGRVARKGGAFYAPSCVESASSSTTTTSVFYFNLGARARRSKGRRVLFAVVAQMVENASCKRGHVGSNPIGGSSVPAFAVIAQWQSSRLVIDRF